MNSQFRRVYGADPGDVADGLLWSPWIGHWFPGLTPERMRELTIRQLVSLHEFVEGNSG